MLECAFVLCINFLVLLSDESLGMSLAYDIITYAKHILKA